MSEDPTTTPAPSDAPPAASGAADGEHVTVEVVVPTDGLASFYRSVADWWERYEREVRGRVMR